MPQPAVEAKLRRKIVEIRLERSLHRAVQNADDEVGEIEPVIFPSVVGRAVHDQRRKGRGEYGHPAGLGAAARGNCAAFVRRQSLHLQRAGTQTGCLKNAGERGKIGAEVEPGGRLQRGARDDREGSLACGSQGFPRERWDDEARGRQLEPAVQLDGRRRPTCRANFRCGRGKRAVVPTRGAVEENCQVTRVDFHRLPLVVPEKKRVGNGEASDGEIHQIHQTLLCGSQFPQYGEVGNALRVGAQMHFEMINIQVAKTKTPEQ